METSKRCARVLVALFRPGECASEERALARARDPVAVWSVIAKLAAAAPTDQASPRNPFVSRRSSHPKYPVSAWSPLFQAVAQLVRACTQSIMVPGTPGTQALKQPLFSLPASVLLSFPLSFLLLQLDSLDALDIPHVHVSQLQSLTATLLLFPHLSPIYSPAHSQVQGCAAC